MNNTDEKKAGPFSAEPALSVEFFAEHQRELFPFTRKYIGPANLDLGCGNGLTSYIHQRELGVAPTLGDVADIRHKLARGFPFFVMKGGKLPFADNAFDSSYLQYVLHHLTTEQAVGELLAEAARVARRVVIVEEIAGARTDVARAKKFDQEVNDQIHPGTLMPVYKYYTKGEIERLFEKLSRKLVFHAVVSIGTPENGFLETQVFVAE